MGVSVIYTPPLFECFCSLMTTSFFDKVLTWFDLHGRKNLPWQQDINPYRVWVSEIMLQQTQVKTVIPYFERFMESFPNVQALANADQNDVLKHWSGLGYYARARNMHKAAKMVCGEFAGKFPETLEEMESLSGIGRSTAAAILSISKNQKQAILDGNVKRVLCRVFMVDGWPGKSAVLKQLWQIADELVPDQRNADYTQAMMDLGATLCTRSKPHCDKCPLQKDCLAYLEDKIIDFPHKKPKKTLPERHAIMLLIQNSSNEVFMQKRPPVGIWGGLWCFPQFENRENAIEWLNKNCAYNINEAVEIPTFTHTFSHFKLHIQALKIPYKTPIKLAVMESDDRLWYNINKEFDGGLAAPVSQLLDLLKKESENGKNG